MKLEDIHSVFFIGIGGIGMSALARWFRLKGIPVGGYDRTRSNLCEELEKEGMQLTYEDEVSTIPEDFRKEDERFVVIYTPAIPADNKIFSYYNDGEYQLYKRSAILGMITRDHFTIAIAGTHGKTTTSALLAHILKQADQPLQAFLGGITINEDSNFIVHRGSGPGPDRVVVEADEFDRSFLTLNPDVAVITALDPDHLDVYGDLEGMKATYTKFVENIRDNGILIIRKHLFAGLHPDSGKKLNIYEYSLHNHTIRADDIHIEGDMMRFSYISPDVVLSNIPYTFPGYHNIENAIAAITVALLLGINPDLIKSAISSFRGIRRRFEYKLYTDRVIFIDDYAHHPEEIRAFLTSVRDLYPERKLTAVFQPHLYSRTQDFAREFAENLEIADEVILLEIYPAREEPIAGVTSELILNLIRDKKKYLVPRDQLVEFLKKRELEVLLTIGAGDIDRLVIPIKKMLEERYEISA